MNALDGIEAIDNYPTTNVEGIAHVCGGTLVTGQGLEGSQLGNVRDVTGEVRLQVCRGADGRLGAHHPPQAPAGHGVCFCHTVDQNALVGKLWHCFDDGHGVGEARFIDQVLVDLIGNNPQPVLESPLANRGGFLAGHHRTGRVGGRDKHDGRGLRGSGCFELLDSDLVVLIGTGEDFHGNTTG